VPKDGDDAAAKAALATANTNAAAAKTAAAAAQTALDDEYKTNEEIKTLKTKLAAAMKKVNGERPTKKDGETSWAAVKRIVGEGKALYRDLPTKMSGLSKARMAKEINETALEHTFWKKVVTEVEAADGKIVAWKNKSNKLVNETAAAKAFAAAQKKLHAAEVAYKVEQDKANATVNVTDEAKKALDLAVASFETSCAKATVLLANGLWSHAPKAKKT